MDSANPSNPEHPRDHPANTSVQDFPLLPFQKAIVQELLEEDGLTVLGEGLGACSVVGALLAVHHSCQESGGSAIILGASPLQRAEISAELKRLAPHAPPIADVTADMTAKERTDLYRSSRHLYITTRILVVDLLISRLPVTDIAGMIVLNAHRVTEESGEGFCVRLLRCKNRNAFLRGISDSPGQVSSGLHSLERVMRALHVRRVFLWPRYHHLAQQDIHEVDVCEIECELSPSMANIQAALVQVLDSMLKTVQRTHKLDSSELSLENAFSRSFEHTIRRQLEPIWNTLTQSTHTTVRDMRTVQELIQYLLRFNCVSFLRYLHCLKASAGIRTEWMLHSAANTVFQEAKSRVFKVSRPPPKQAGQKAGKAQGAQLQPVMEEMPKWTALCEVMQEVQRQRATLARRAMHLSRGGPAGSVVPGATTGRPSGSAQPCDLNVLENREAHAASGTGAGAQNSERAVLGTRPEPQAQECTGHCDERLARTEQGSRGDAIVDLTATQLSEASSGPLVVTNGNKQCSNSQGKEGGDAGGEDEHADAWIDALQPEELETVGDAPVLVLVRDRYMLTELQSVVQAGSGRPYLRKLLDMYLVERTSSKAGKAGGKRDSSTRAKNAQHAAKPAKQRTKKEQQMYKLQMLNAGDDEEAAVAAAAAMVQDALDAESRDKQGSKRSRPQSATAASKAARTGTGKENGHRKPSANDDGATGTLLEGVHFAAMDEPCGPLLHQLRPVFVVLYDLDLSWVRNLEVFQSSMPNRVLKVYMLSFHNSVEQAKFQLAASNEKQSFIHLIQKKAHMVLPIDEAGNLAVIGTPSAELARSQQLVQASQATGNALTRHAGGALARATKRAVRVVVDVREFMSSLPAVLFRRGMDVVPVTLEVADFVLTDALCVERKAIPDLMSSLESGRLYTQAVAMCKHYKTPVLLIEFDANRAFALQSINDISADIRAANVASRLVLLLLNFPTLRLVWSRSLHATADLFLLLKNSQPDPDPEVAAAVGLDEADADTATVANPVARDMLLKLPGVTPANVYKLMEAAESLAGIADMDRKELQRVLGTQNGKACFEFLHMQYPTPQ